MQLAVNNLSLKLAAGAQLSLKDLELLDSR